MKKLRTTSVHIRDRFRLLHFTNTYQFRMEIPTLKFVFILMIVWIMKPNSASQAVLNSDEDHKVSKSKKDANKENTFPSEPHILQKIRVPVGGPYCYAEILKPIDYIAAPPRITRYTPQMRDESAELMEPTYSNGIIENVWPYERNQSRREREIRKYFRLNVSSERYNEVDRMTGKSAERAFISRYYGFINSSKNGEVDDLIRFIEDTEKIENHFALDTGPDPRADFNSFSEKKKSKFCQKFINHSVILFEQNVIFDASRADEIIRQRVSLKYKNPYLLALDETVDVVKCPCLDTSDNTPIQLGVLPIRYKFKKVFSYAFIYDITKKAKNEANEDEVGGIDQANVRALTKIDVEGVRKERERKLAQTQDVGQRILTKILVPVELLHQHHQSNLEETEEDNKTKGEEEENNEGTGHRILHTILAPMEHLHLHHRRSPSSDAKQKKEIRQEEDREKKSDESSDEEPGILHSIFERIKNHHHEHSKG